MNPAKITVVVIDRNAADLASLTQILEDIGYRVLSATTEAHVERFAETEAVNLVVKGFDASRADTIAFMRQIKAISRDTEFILCGRGGSIEDAVDAIHQGASEYLQKPVSAEALAHAVQQALERQSIVAEDPKLRQSLKRRTSPDVFAGSSPRMRQFTETLAEVATTDIPLLVTGESGTGKELAARAIHARSRRQSGPFIAINCAGLADSLIESELFGHVRGAFTGAVQDRPGAFQIAAGGTLFLDEIGDLSPKGQGDLLRVLEDGVFRPLGSPHAVTANVRIVAATNRDLARRANEGRFREDLLYRLNIVEIDLPPLRERAADIPALVTSFNTHFCARHSRRQKHFTPEFLAQLARHPWPGNIRQLRNLIERIVVTTRATEIGPELAPPIPAEFACATQAATGTGGTTAAPMFSVHFGMTAAEVEALLIRHTLEKLDGHRAEAARVLGLSRRTLHYRLSSAATPQVGAEG